ncbi:citrate transporter [uncultured Thiodictyon sp.]|uniref:citrate transporter n=1 Tax=uncultured Thiodictyon sp. TaxID=1846217 RepID=UPI0025D765B5|nr:citrate transporter [uncultured Thiodictyon sp.]
MPIVAHPSAHPIHRPSSGAHRRFVAPLCVLLCALPSSAALAAAPAVAPATIQLFGIPVEFFLFAAILVGVAIFHRSTLAVALSGLAAITAFKLGVTGFNEGSGVAGLLAHLSHEWVMLTNLLGLLLGFALLARHFEDSRIPLVLPRFLPAGWPGGLVLLVMIFVLSSFLDNIAAALIGGTIAGGVYRHRVHIGYLAAIVAASNAGGAGSVVGDTTTTMMWISGVAPLDVARAYVAAGAALLVCGIVAAIQQDRYAPIERASSAGVSIDWPRVGIVAAILINAIAVNLLVNLYFTAWADGFPFLGVTVCATLLAAARLRQPEWSLLPEAFKGSVFLLALTFAASMMPVAELPAASWSSTLGIGFVSGVFNNIPLTALALEQGGYDWAWLAFAVGFGGSMIWFGSSAGVAIANLYPEARSVADWVRQGWHVTLAYLVGFAMLPIVLGWHPPTSAVGPSITPPAHCCTDPQPGPRTDPPRADREPPP